VTQLIRDIRAENEPFQDESLELETSLNELEQAAEAINRGMGHKRYRMAWKEWRGKQRQQAALDAFQSALDVTSDMLKVLAERSQGLDQCATRAQILQTRLALLARCPDADGDAHSEIPVEEENQPQIRWVENFPTGFA